MLKELFACNPLILIAFAAAILFGLVADAPDAGAEGKKKDVCELTSITKSVHLERDGLVAAVFRDKVWIIGGDGEEGIVSVEGLADWKPGSKDENLTLLGHTVVPFEDALWVMGGNNISGFADGILSSPDGIEWSRNEVPFSRRSDHSSVSFGGKIWVLGGSGEELEAFSDVWNSPDGREWELVTSEAAFGKRHLHASVVFDGKIWVIGGTLYSESEDSEDVWYSSDGKKWELATSEPGFKSIDGLYRAATYDGKIWVASMEEDGLTLWSSADGKTWEALMPANPMHEDVQSLVVYHDEMYAIIFGEILKFEYGSGRSTD